MASISSYKCPNCSASIPFDAASGQLKCGHCGTSFEMDKLNEFNVEQELEADVCEWNLEKKETVGTEDKVAYVCPACGGEVVGDENMSATACPYCGTPIVVGDKLDGMLKPDMLIPFRLTKDQAKEKYYEFLKKKVFLPNDFKVNNLIDKIQGIYVPYWLFDADASGQARFRCTRTRHYRSGDYEITETSYYLVYRDGSASFEKVPVDASSKLNDALLDSLEPFDYKECTDFNPAYLSSYLADKYDQNEDETISKANYRIKNSMINILASSVIGYDSVIPQGASVQFRNGKAHYALLPVYIFSSRYKGEVYQFAMNGQTGKFAGDLPMDKGKATVYSLMIFLGVFIVTFLIIFFMSKGGM